MKLLITSIVDLRGNPHNRIHEFLKRLAPHHDIVAYNIVENRPYKQATVNEEDTRLASDLKRIDLRSVGFNTLDPTVQDILSPFRTSISRETMNNSFDVHLSFSRMLFTLIASRTLATADIPSIYDIADDLPGIVAQSKRIPRFMRNPATSISRIVLRENVRIAKSVTAITDELTAIGTREGVASATIPNGVDCDLFKPDYTNGLRAELGLGESFVVGYEGAIREWVDFRPLLASMKELARQGLDVKLLVVGQDYGKRELENLIEVAVSTMISAEARKESRGAHVRDDAPDTEQRPNGRDDENWLKHTLWYKDGNRLDYKAVKLTPLSVETIALKKRAY